MLFRPCSSNRHIPRFDGLPSRRIARPIIKINNQSRELAHRRPLVGTGLGLSIVKIILEQHQAAYGVCNQSDCGCTFWFELPAAPA